MFKLYKYNYFIRVKNSIKCLVLNNFILNVFVIFYIQYITDLDFFICSINTF